MAQATISARIDEKDKMAFDNFCSEVGLNTSAAINLFVKAVLREKRIPFEISQTSDPFYSESNQKHLMKAIQELRDGKGKPHDLIEVDKVFDDAESDKIAADEDVLDVSKKMLKRNAAVYEELAK